jgi:hypothetical protein
MGAALQVDPKASFEFRIEQLKSKLPEEERAVRTLSSDIGAAKERMQELREVFAEGARKWLGGKNIKFDEIPPLLSLYTFCANGVEHAKSKLEKQIEGLELDAVPGVKKSLKEDLAAFSPFGDAREMLVDAGVPRKLCKLIDFAPFKETHKMITLVEEQSHWETSYVSRAIPGTLSRSNSMTDDADYEYESVPSGGSTVIDRHGQYFNAGEFKNTVEGAVTNSLLGENKKNLSSLEHLTKVVRSAIESQVSGDHADTVYGILVNKSEAIADLVEFVKLTKRVG